VASDFEILPARLNRSGGELGNFGLIDTLTTYNSQ